MAATITSAGSGTSTTNNKTVSTGATISVQAGDWLVLILATSNSGSTGGFSATPSSFSGHAWTTRVGLVYNIDGTANNSAGLGIYTTAITSTVTNGTITVTFADNTPQKALQVYRVRPGSGETVSYVSRLNDPDAEGTLTSHSPGSISVTSGYTIFAAAAIETDDTVTGDSDTSNGSWSAVVTRLADGGADADAISSVSQYKTTTGTGTQTWTCTVPVARDGCAGAIVLKSIVPAVNFDIEALAGSYAVTGTDASPKRGRKVTADAGSYAVTGTNANLNKGKTLVTESGSYSVTGTAAALLHGWKVAAEVGSYEVVGSDVTLTHVGPHITAGVGSYTVTGTAAAFVKGRKVAAGAGSYAVTGTNANLNKGRTLVAGAGSYAVTGVTASLEHGWKVTAAAGSYTVTGKTAQLLLSSAKFIEAGVGSYLVTGTTVLLDHDEDPEEARGGMPLKMYAPRVHNYVEVTPLIQAAAYSANDIVFTATEVPNASWRTTPGGEEMFVESIAILDEADNAAADWTFYFGRSTFTLGSINGAVNISDADARLITSVYTMDSTEFADLTNSMLGYASNLHLSVIPADGSKSIYVAATTAGTPTFGSTSDIKLKLHIVS